MEKDFYLSHIALQINQPKVRYPQKMTDKIKNILKLLSTTKINKDFLQEYSFLGIPDECNGLRSLCWKILLGYLPYWPSRWETTLAISRNKYAKLVKEHILSNPKLISKSPRKSLSDGDNILKSVEGINTQGNMFEATKEPRLSDKTHVSTSDRTEDKLWNEIGKDTKRTRSGMHFFQKAVDVVLDNKENIEKSQVESHIDVLTRILYIYGKTHPEIGYTQGMNELLAPIYYCFANDQNPAFKGHAEADSYFCFEAMMEELKDSFIQMLNKKEVGIQARIQRMDKILQKLDVEVWKHLNNHDVQPFFYSLRWLMLLLTQEFELTEVLRLWDTLFGHTKRFEYLNYICIGMIQQVRDKLMETKDFSTLMSILQKESACDLDEVLSLAFRLYKKHTTPEDSLPQIIFLV